MTNYTNHIKVLQIIIQQINNQFTNWWIEGSLALNIWGLEVPVRDLDIVTDDLGIDFFYSALKDYQPILKNDPQRGRYISLYIADQEIEISSFADRQLNVFGRAEIVMWQGLQIPVLPLPLIRELYANIKRTEKVQLIDEFINTL